MTGFLVLGISSRLRFDEHYRDFCDRVTSQVATAIANARAWEEVRERAEALAETDRAKTTFFSNISHEFRTPLTLMLGPIEDMLSRSHDSFTGSREELDLLHRNTLRLLKLVNKLLDFSRIEAGRMQAAYEPVDLPAFTAELASVFRSAVEKAGLRLSVNCRPLDEPVYVDRAMWEKIVLNLLSNAFKFTFAGEITVSLRKTGQSAELYLRDTGTGIPEHELPHIFDRFHRVEGARGRTYEGSGIGLALVQELVTLHHGTMRVESVYNRGSGFTVSIPLDRKHLPARNVDGPKQSFTVGAEVYADEALHWLPAEMGVPYSKDASPPEIIVESEERPAGKPSSALSHILLADDNADMRQYIKRLLAGRYEVHAVSDGEAALAAALKNPPDLVLTDIMMPRRDGFELLQALRTDARTRGIPVILLSARAGEESRVEGFEAGAIDYLVKPFSARELLARVSAGLEMARFQREALGRERYLRRCAEDAENRTATILESIVDSFAALDWDWRFTYVNATLERTVGRSRQELLGRTIWEMFPEALGTIFEREYRRAVAEDVSVAFEGYFALLDRWFAVNAYPSEDGGLTIYARDITDKKRAAAEIDRKSEELLQLRTAAVKAAKRDEELKSVLLDALAHEIKSPLTSIKIAVNPPFKRQHAGSGAAP